MRKLSILMGIVFLISLCVSSGFAKVTVGEVVDERFETAHPYGGSGLVAEKIFHWPKAGYISLHFANFDLAPGDYVQVTSPDGRFSYVYKEKGKEVRGGQEVLNTFWASHIPGDTAIVRLYAKNPKSGWGFAIDKWVRGYEQDVLVDAFIQMEGEAEIEAICGTDDKEWAPCYSGTTMYDKARAVCRLLINGNSACTGFLLGSEGHVMTNYHCIGGQSDADNTDYEFMAEGATCTTNCTGWFACPGVVEASSGLVEGSDYNLDYCLVLLPTNVTSTYGYMQFRNALPVIDERIYIPQHPGAYGKQLAVYSTDSHDQSGYGEVYSTDEPPCIGGPGDIGYFADTAGGSSGSPVLAYDDHLVVALHHCANCPNRGVPIPAIVSDLGAAIPNDAIGGGGSEDPPAAPSNLTARARGKAKVALAWSDNSSNETGFYIYRSTDGVNFNLYDTVGANITAYTDTNVQGSTTYYYKVCAYNTYGEACSNIASAYVK
jgi:hypothetical protein